MYVLYPHPCCAGEEPGTSQGRQNIFARWSARMGLSTGGLNRASSEPLRPKSPRRSNLGPGAAGGGGGGGGARVGDPPVLSAPLPSR